MKQNILIGILVVIALGEGALVIRYRNRAHAVAAATPVASQRPAPMFLTRGMKLADSPLMKYAYLIAPGTPDAAAKQALNGFDIDAQTQKDGTVTVKLTPHDSDDQNQQYVLKPNQKLYFIEQTPLDDKDNTDSNLRDDYGVIVDANGIVQ